MAGFISVNYFLSTEGSKFIFYNLRPIKILFIEPEAEFVIIRMAYQQPFLAHV